MTIDDLYALVDALLPPLVVALLALAVTVVVLVKALRRRHPRAVIIAVGTANISLVYFWMHLAGLSAEERALGIRLALVFLLICILIYSVRVRPWLKSILRRRKFL